MDSTSFQGLVTALAQENLPLAEKSDLEWYESRVQAWETEKKELIQREKELREKAEQEKAERLATRAAAEQAWPPSMQSQPSVYTGSVFDVGKYSIWLCHFIYTIIIYICNIIQFEINIKMLPKWFLFSFLLGDFMYWERSKSWRKITSSHSFSSL